MVHEVVVARLRRATAPRFGWIKRADAMAHPPCREYLDPFARAAAQEATWIQGRRRTRWDLGRVRAFVELIEAGWIPDPIVLWCYSITVADGEHRVAAAAICGVPRLSAVFAYGAQTETARWLMGLRRYRPVEG